MVRIVIVSIICLAILIGLGMIIYGAVKADEPKGLPAGDKKLNKLGPQAIRELDKALLDPMYATSDEWRRRAQKIVDEYHGDK